LADLNDDAVKVARYLYKHGFTGANSSIVVARLRVATRLAADRFDAADTFLLESGAVRGTIGGDDGWRFLTPTGITWVTAKAAAAKTWSGKDIVFLLLGLIAAVLAALVVPEVRHWLGLS
jgi:hypothetical protein